MIHAISFLSQSELSSQTNCSEAKAMDRFEIHDVKYERPEDNVNKAEYYIQQLNVNNAKKVALCLVLGFICYHGLIHLRYGQYSYTSIQFAS